jgi:CDP-glycerol glycerophosphotransferase
MPRDVASRQRWDLVLTADAWNHTPVRRCRRRMQFFHGVAGKYDLDAPERLKAAQLHRFDRVAFINDDRMRRYIQAGVVPPERAVLVGFPKGDDLVNGRWSRAEVRKALALEADRQTVLYAPTFSTAGSLHLAGVEIVRALLDAELNVIVKLHDRSMVPDDHHTAGVDWPLRFAAFGGHPRFALAPGPDAAPYLAAADVLVTDHSSVGFEFALLDRPIVVFDAPDLREAARIDTDKWDLLRSMAAVVRTPEETTRAVRAALAQPSIGTAARHRARDLFASAGTATQRALAVVYELLEVPPLPLERRRREAAALSAVAGAGK